MIWLVGCAPRPELPLNVSHLTTREVIEKSSAVVIGEVRSIDVSGKRVRSEEGILLRRWRVEVTALAVLRGLDQRSRTVAFFLNSYDPGVVQNGNFEWLRVGDRRIFFLVGEGDHLRAVSDLYSTSMVFPHASVPVVRRDEKEATSDKIASVLLTQADGESAQSFASMVSAATTEALKSSSYAFVATILSQLLASPSPDIRREACLAAYEQLFASDSCVGDLERSGIDQNLSMRVLKARGRRAYLHRLASNELREARDSPLVSYAYGVEPEDPLSVLGFLEFVSHQPDPVLRQSAESQLQKLRAGGKADRMGKMRKMGQPELRD
jgi:hypothetical protein